MEDPGHVLSVFLLIDLTHAEFGVTVFGIFFLGCPGGCDDQIEKTDDSYQIRSIRRFLLPLSAPKRSSAWGTVERSTRKLEKLLP